MCDSYSLDIRYLATKIGGDVLILDAILLANPLPIAKTSNFSIQAGTLIAGQKTFPRINQRDLLRKITQAAEGKIDVDRFRLRLPAERPYDYYSEAIHRDKWFFDLHLLISGSTVPPISVAEAIDSDQRLRGASPPFDGISDLCSWLGLTDPRSSGRASTINIRVNPPVDMIFDQSQLASNTFNLTLHAHARFDRASIGLAIREYPGDGLSTRKQVAPSIKWGRVKDGRRPGILKIGLKNSDSVLAILSIRERTVRRQWFLDPDKAQNHRYVATQLFDKDLKQLRAAIESTDSTRFEKGVASLLFLLGFTPALQIETDAPDIIVTTQGGKLAIIECTTRIADFNSKIGKLVDRRNLLAKTMESTGHNLRIDAFLVCGLSRAQIASNDVQLAQHQISLLAREDISRALEQIRTPTNPDEMLEQAASRLAQSRPLLG